MVATGLKYKKYLEEHNNASLPEWLPTSFDSDMSHDTHQLWVKKLFRCAEDNPKTLHPVIAEFKATIATDTRLTMLVESMFSQDPQQPQYHKKLDGYAKIHDLDHLCAILNHIITAAPSWTDVRDRMGLIAVPMAAVLDGLTGTRSGFTVFQDPTVNQHLERILNTWGRYLSSPASAHVLGTDEHGWFGDSPKMQLEHATNLGQTPVKSFEELFECDPAAPHHGFASWDAFFTRRFRFSAGIRPVAAPGDDSVVANPCESTPYRVATGARAHERFWVKGRAYSVHDMLAHDERAPAFVGGTVYQAVLSALAYHRWHAPVSGIVRAARVIPGLYFSAPPFDEFVHAPQGSTCVESTSLEYLSAVATRALLLIEADNPKIGLMAFLAVGIADISSCEITVKEGQHVTKGDEIGSFHYGGSTHCCLFRKGVQVEGLPQPGQAFSHPVRAALGRVI